MRSKFTRFLTVSAAALVISGCATAKVSRTVVADLGADDQDTQIDFWHTLATKPVACNDDAFHAIILDLDETDPNADFSARVSALKARGLLLNSFTGGPNDAVSRGVVAVALCQAAGIKGGLIMHLTGPSERYCLREMQYMNLLPPSSPNQTFSGLELVGVIGRFEDYERGNPSDLPASEMPAPEPPRGNPQLLKQPHS